MEVVASDGQRVSYDLVEGPPGAPTLVWAHGFLLSADFYRELAARLPAYGHLLTDLRAHGRTGAVGQDDTGADATLARMADDLWEVAQHAGLDRFVVVGHSMGGAVVTRLAASHPDAVLAGVSLAGVPVGGKQPEARDGLVGLVDLAGDEAAFRAMLGALHVHHDADDEPVARAAAAATVVGRGTIAQVVEEFFRDDAAALLPGLSQPWLFVVPGADTAEPPDHQLTQAALLPDSRHVVLDGEGHMVPQEQPDLVAAKIRSFLGQVLPTR